jgi:endogenous inhibitor of DNA gyrase (YacG/DUF329 family)
MGSIICPICGKTFERLTSKAMPFCSEQCRLVDLGRWMGERYALPTEREHDEVDAAHEDLSVPGPSQE